MKKTATFASSFLVKAALCCSVAVLLTACGGTTDDLDSQQSLAAMTASATMEATSGGATGAVDAGPEAPASIVHETATPDAAAQASDSVAATAAPATAPMPADTGLASGGAANPGSPAAGSGAPASAEFNLSGYQEAPAVSSSDATTQGKASSADGQQAIQLPAA
ncbi:hypothetical protein [Massilia sp. HP4]|uniref:hypothetical protein n=1 Tax=Massilia sp. HP4 TaxID=2562316 RepID=UPI0010C0FAAE|nr:hypothetical protein [Massilia sp. HP4]